MTEANKTMTSQFHGRSVEGSSCSRRLRLFGVLIATICATQVSSSVWAQSFQACADGTDICSTPSTANVGIGIGTNTPLGTLQVSGTTPVYIDRYSANGSALALRTAGGTFSSPTAVTNGSNIGKFLVYPYDGSSFFYTAGIYGVVDGTVATGSVPTDLTFGTGSTSASMTERMRITSTGNVGIGTTTPGSLVEVHNGNFRISRPTDGNGFVQQVTENGALNIGYMLSSTDSSWYAGVPSMTMLYTGNIGIGTTAPIHPLQVAGIIGAEEVIVSSTGADYVFKPDYYLRPLSELATYIKENHRLPGIPSAEEAQAKGVGLGDMQTKMLAKVEELTLHLIQVDQENQELRTRIAKLEAHRVSHRTKKHRGSDK
jgi:hypothetical protein